MGEKPQAYFIFEDLGVTIPIVTTPPNKVPDTPFTFDCVSTDKRVEIQYKIYDELIHLQYSRKKPRKLNRLYRQLKRLQKGLNND